MEGQHKYVLDESEMPTHWYNIVPDLPVPPPPPLHPGTHEPVGPEDLAPLFPMELILQEVSGERFIEIPQAVLDVYKQWRPSPLFRARRLEEKLGTPARIYYKYEGVSPAGSHKTNTAVPQVYYNAQHGVARLTTETGAGQWGTALAYACSLFGMECEVWQVGTSFDTKPQRRTLIEVFGGTVHRSPSRLTQSGQAFPEDHPGTLGIAISEAVEVAAQDESTKYSLGSVLNHVLLHQTDHRRGSASPAGQGRRGPRRPGRRLRRRWLQLRRPGVPVPAREARREPGPDDPGGRAVLVPDAHPRGVPLRLRRHGRVDPPDEDVHPGPRLCAFDDPRGRAALPRHGAAGLPRRPRGLDRGGRPPPAGVLRARRSSSLAPRAWFPRPSPPTRWPRSAGRRLACAESGEEKVIVVGLSGHGLLELGAYADYLADHLADDPLSEEALTASLAEVPVI